MRSFRVIRILTKSRIGEAGATGVPDSLSILRSACVIAPTNAHRPPRSEIKNTTTSCVQTIAVCNSFSSNSSSCLSNGELEDLLFRPKLLPYMYNTRTFALPFNLNTQTLNPCLKFNVVRTYVYMRAGGRARTGPIARSSRCAARAANGPRVTCSATAFRRLERARRLPAVGDRCAARGDRGARAPRAGAARGV